MRTRPAAAAVAAVLGALSVAGCSDSNDTKNQAVTKVDFIGMDAPATTEQKADMYSGARVVYTFESGATAEYQLQYHKIFDTTTTVGGNVVGGLYSAVGSLGDNDGQMASDAPDGTSLMTVSGLSVPGATGNPLAMVTQFEYKALPPNDGVSTGDFWSKMPAAMGITLLDQGKAAACWRQRPTATSTSRASRAAGSTAARRCRHGTLI